MATFSYTGQIETFTVASSGEYELTLDGAQGGSGDNGADAGGAGAIIGGDVYLQAGEKLEIVVGGEGGSDGSFGGGGGGGSFVIETYNGSSTVDTVLAVAGGGGGGGGVLGSTKDGGAGQAGPTGGHGGGNEGGAGGHLGDPGAGPSPGPAGTLAGGGGGGFTGGPGSVGTSGVGPPGPGAMLGTSFDGGKPTVIQYPNSHGGHTSVAFGGVGGFGGGGGGGSNGGGGGGGDGGGGSGAGTSTDGGGGGGGGSYFSGAATTESAGVHSGDGLVVLTQLPVTPLVVGAGQTYTDTSVYHSLAVTVVGGTFAEQGQSDTNTIWVSNDGNAYEEGDHNTDTVTLGSGYYVVTGAGNHYDLTIANGGVGLDGGFENSGTVTVESGGVFNVAASAYGASDIIYLQTGAQSTDLGSASTGTVHLEGGTFTEDGTGATTAIDMSGGGKLILEQSFGGTISGLNAGGQIEVSLPNTSPNSEADNYQIDAANHTVTLDFGSGSETLQFDSVVNLSVSTSGDDFVITSSTPVCFVTGSRIRTTRGEVAVEDLAVGDLAVTASGAVRPIGWIGHKPIERPSPEQQPIRVMAGAFGEGLPARDLRLSHGHGVCVDVMGEVLVPVGELVNGVSIVRQEVAEVTYWHVELESHDVLWAEGLPCESYLDTGNRDFFGRADGRLAAIEPDRTLADSCRPFIAEGPIVAAIHERLASRAEALVGVARTRRHAA
jgi:hypothetical protein